jgi:hypothetical protein
MTIKKAALLLLLASLYPRLCVAGKWGSVDPSTLSCGGAPDAECSSTPSKQGACGPRSLLAPRMVRLGTQEQLANPTHAQGRQPGTYVRYLLKEHLEWIMFATWSKGEKSILLTDPVHDSIFVYDTSANRVEHIVTPQGTGPAFIVQAPGGGYVANNQKTLTWLTNGFESLRTDNINSRQAPSEEYMDLVLHWAPIDQSLLFLGELKKHLQGKDDVFSGAAIIKWQQGDACCRLWRLKNDDRLTRTFFHTGYPMLTSVRNHGYALIMQRTPYILELGAEPRRLAAFPTSFMRRPDLPVLQQSTAAEFFRRLAGSQVAVGLFGWAERLFILTRRPLPHGETEWLLWRVDPTMDRIDPLPSLLPTRAEHIVLAPGRQKWALIEKGPVKKLGSQLVTALVIFDVPRVARNESVTEGGKTVRLDNNSGYQNSDAVPSGAHSLVR